MLRQALALYRKHFGALVLTCAVALVPANLLAAGTLVFGLASLGSGGVAEARTHTQQIQEKQQELREQPSSSAETQQTLTRQLGRDAFEGSAAPDLRHLLSRVLPIAYAIVIIAGLLLAGLFLAHAAAVPLVLSLARREPASAAHAWAQVAARLGAVISTGLLAVALVALGSLFLIVPGLLLAVGFSLAAPIALLEGISGRAALERSWRMLQGHWRWALLLWAAIVAISLLASAAAALVPPGALRPLAASAVRVILYPLPLAGLVLLYREASQYMRRTSAPG